MSACIYLMIDALLYAVIIAISYAHVPFSKMGKDRDSENCGMDQHVLRVNLLIIVVVYSIAACFAAFIFVWAYEIFCGFLVIIKAIKAAPNIIEGSTNYEFLSAGLIVTAITEMVVLAEITRYKGYWGKLVVHKSKDFGGDNSTKKGSST